ncbi:MAG: hypothetical protein AABY53_06310 [Bdellovibrionota bacterium]
MNKLLFFLLTLSSVGSYASKARMQALANSFHFVDAQTVFKRPIDLIYLDNFVLLESGITAATSAQDNSEAMLSYSLKKNDSENHRIAASFGHQEASVIEARQFIKGLSGTNIELQQNPLHLFYAVDDAVTSYAVGLFYSTKDEKLTGLKESSAGLSLGAEIGKFQISALYVSMNSVRAAGGKQFDGAGYLQAQASYLSDTTLFEFTFKTSRPKLTTEVGGVTTLTESHTHDVATLGLADSNTLGENEFFWGGQVVSMRINCNHKASVVCNKIYTNTSVPAWFGIEAQATDWLVFRSAIKQSFLVNITKDDVGYPAAAISGATGAIVDLGAGANSTSVTAGVGLKFKNLTLDGVLSTASTQVLDARNLLSQLALTYGF